MCRERSWSLAVKISERIYEILRSLPLGVATVLGFVAMSLPFFEKTFSIKENPVPLIIIGVLVVGVVTVAMARYLRTDDQLEHYRHHFPVGETPRSAALRR